MLQDCTSFVKFGLTLAIPVTVARHDPAKKGRCGEARKIDGGEISCQKGADEHGQEGEEKEPAGCQEEHASVLSNRLSPFSQEPCQKCP